VRIWTISDLHLEISELDAPLSVPDADVCVIAGDLTQPLAGGVRWIAANILPRMPCVYVPGNHEFYGSSISEGLAEGLAEASRHEGLHLLADGEAVIDGVRFLGCTLWTDFRLFGNQPLAMMAANLQMRDFRYIATGRDPTARLCPEDVCEMHSRSRRFLETALAEPFDGPTVVVTHHAPHPGSVAPRYQHDTLTPAYASDLSGLIEAARPALWIHGHVHGSFDYHAGATRVVCNPRGYGRQNGNGFDPAKVIGIGS